MNRIQGTTLDLFEPVQPAVIEGGLAAVAKVHLAFWGGPVSHGGPHQSGECFLFLNSMQSLFEMVIKGPVGDMRSITRL